jgi:hypothetical protein
MRLRMVAELLTLALLTGLFLAFAPDNYHNTGTYFGLALVAFGLVAFGRTETRERIWGPPESPAFDRVRRCTVNMSMFTIPPIALFLILGLAQRYVWPSIQFEDVPKPITPMVSLHFLAALVIYPLWAMLQQTLFQFYLLGRLRALLPFASPLLLSTLNGFAYGLVHLPSGYLLTLVTILGGIVWSYSYYRDRYVFPIALSHGLLATTFYYWIIGRDVLGEMLQRVLHHA